LSGCIRYHPLRGSVNGIGRAPMDTTPADEKIEVKTRIVGCDGGGGALGHPLVYLQIGNSGDIVCPYCSRHFVLADGAGESHGH
jgi:uncharacterized Zn-finger protein